MRIVSDLEADAMLYMCHRMMGAVLKYKASTKVRHRCLRLIVGIVVGAFFNG